MIWVGAALGASLALTLDLDEDDGGLTPEPGNLQWEYGEPSTGPGEGFTGTNVWATRLDGPYLNDAEGALVLPAADLSGLTAPQLTFWMWSDIHVSDVGRVEVLDGGWTLIEPVYGYPSAEGFSGRSDGWQFAVFDLTGVDDLSQVRLRFVADPALQDEGWYIDDIQVWDGDIAEPQVQDLDQLEDTEDLDGPYTVSVLVEDDSALDSVDLLVSFDGGAEEPRPMVLEGGRWVADIEGQDPDTRVSYAVLATDVGGNTTREPEVAYESFRVRLPAPTELTGPEGRVIDVRAQLDWSPPDSIHTVLEYRIWRDEEVVDVVDAPPAEVDLYGDDRFSVSAVFDVGEGDRSKVLVLDSARPQVLDVDPQQMYQGESLRLTVEGAYLLLVDGDVTADLGEGVTVGDIEVLDVDRCTMEIEIAETAPVGDRVLRLSTNGVEVADASILVMDGQDRPALVDIEPDRMTQGESALLRIRSSVPLADVPLVDLGEGIVVEKVTLSDDTTVLVDVVAGYQTVGWRSVELDDGQRVLSGVEFEVEPWAPPVETCGHVPASGAVLVLVGLAVSRRRSDPPAG